jgi:hypothetical protein
MSNVENYDGLCGIIPSFAHSGLQIRCKYELGHGGSCSFEKYRKQFRLWGGSSCSSGPPLPEEGFLISVLASMPYDHGTLYIADDDEVYVRR